MKRLLVCVQFICLVFSLFNCATVNNTSDRTGANTDMKASRAYGSIATQTEAPTPPKRDVEFVVQVMESSSPICFSPDGRFLVTISIDKKSLQLWQVSTGRLVRTFAPDRTFIEKVVYDPTGKYLLVVNLSHDIRLVEVTSGKTIGFLDAERSGARVVYAGFTGDGRHVLIKRDPEAQGVVVSERSMFRPEQNSPRLFDVQDGTEVKNYMIADMTEKERCVLTSDGRRFLAEVGHSQFKRTFRLEWFDVETGHSAGRVPLEKGYRFDGLTFAVSPDARYLVTNRSDFTENKIVYQLQIVDLETGSIRLQKISGFLNFVQFSPDGRYLFYKSIGDEIHMMEIASGDEIRTFEKTNYTECFAVSPGGNLIAYTTTDDFFSFFLEDFADTRTIRTIGGLHPILSEADLYFVPGEKAILSQSIGHPLNLTTGEAESMEESKMSPFRFSGDGRRAIMMEWDDEKYQTLGENNTPEMALHEWPSRKRIKTLPSKKGFLRDLSHDGRVALWGEVTSMETKVWHLEESDELVKLQDYPVSHAWRQTSNTAISPDGTKVAAAFAEGIGDKGCVYVWDSQNGAKIQTFNYRKGILSFDSYNISRVAFSPDNRTLVVGLTFQTNKYEGKSGTWLFGYNYWRTLEKHAIDVYTIDNGYKKRTIDGIGAPVTDFAFSPDGDYLFSGATDGVITRWELKSGRRTGSYFTPSSVKGLAISPDGRHMLVQGFATSYWEVESGKHLFSHVQKSDPQNPQRFLYLTWTPDGYYRGSDSLAREYCHLVHGMKTYALDQFFEQFYNPAMIEARVKGFEMETLDVTRVLLDSPPPVVSFSKPVIDNTGIATFSVNARSTGGGVSQIRLFHNGKRIGDGSLEPVKQFQLSENGQGIRDRGIFISTAATAPRPDLPDATAPVSDDMRRTFEIQLLPGENQLRASAFSAQMIECEPATITLFHKGSSNLPHLYLISVGIHQYQPPISQLPMARRDAEGFVQKLTQTAPTLFRNYKVVTLYDTSATRSGILKAMTAVAQKAKPEDMVVFFFAGHGTVLSEDGRFYLVAQGVRDLDHADGETSICQAGVSDLMLGSALQKIPALKQVVFMDACQSGGADFTDSFRNSGREVAIKRIGRNAGTWIFSAAGKTESAYENSGLGHGLFTFALLAGLDGKADVVHSDGTITLSELESFIVQEVSSQAKKIGIQQKPTIQRGLNDFAFSGGHHQK